MQEITILIALFAGLVSFLSPCILAIVPGFLSYLAGTTVDQAKANSKKIFINSLIFVLGFSVVFAGLGVLLNTILERVAFDVLVWMSRIGGVIIIFFGLYLMGIFKIKFLEKEHQIKVKKFESRYLTSFLFGAAFAAGWTPCVGAVLGAILGLAATQPGIAFTLLFAYSVGLGIPFLLVGLFTARAARFINSYAKFFKYAKIVFGVLLIIIGILIFTRNLQIVANVGFLMEFFK